MARRAFQTIISIIILACIFFPDNIYGQARTESKLSYELLGNTPDSLGVAGPFTGLLGVNQDILMLAGGANFAPPIWEAEKEYHNQISLGKLLFEPSGIQWINIDKNLPYNAAYGASVSLGNGIICLGGHNSEEVYDRVLMISMNISGDDLIFTDLPKMPSPATHCTAGLIGDYLYVCGGQSGHGLETATNSLWRLNVSPLQNSADPFSGSYPHEWEILPPLPGPTRAVHTMAAQHNGRNQALYIIGGRRIKDNYVGPEPYELLGDVWEYDPLNTQSPWSRKADPPVNMMAGPGAAFGQSHIFILGGT